LKGFVASMLLAASAAAAQRPVVIGSKKFTESYVLGEIATRSLQRAGVSAEHRAGMGGTIILWEALVGGSIDAYPEYTGTIAQEILKLSGRPTREDLSAALAARGVAMGAPLGFENTYALVVAPARARTLGLARISDLSRHPGLVFGLTHEFLDRADGWRPLAAAYDLSPGRVAGIDHALGYEALRHGSIDVKDAYSTDARIAQDGLVVLEDERRFFPDYQAVFLHRSVIAPRAAAAIASLSGTIDAARMRSLNSTAERAKDYAAGADAYFGGRPSAREGRARRILRLTARHLELVAASLLLAVAIGLPLGIRASRPGPASQIILGATGVVQTIPALALLALLVPVPFLGIGPATAVVALFLYSLLPIVRGTATGLASIPPALTETAESLGLPAWTRLRAIDLPLASRAIVAGIQTSAVIDVGAATLAALIGAGGLGEPIISGLNLNDHATILEGAIPAAILALAVQAGFGLIERIVVPRGLRLPKIES
jgi:osmoprotectant transport system permease protein